VHEEDGTLMVYSDRVLQAARIIMSRALIFVAVGVSAQSPCDSPRKQDLLKCAAQEQAAAQKDLTRYLRESFRILGGSSSAALALRKAQSAWEQFVTADCQAEYEWSGAGEREIQAAFCRAHHVKNRVHELWERYLRASVTELSEPARSPEE